MNENMNRRTFCGSLATALVGVGGIAAIAGVGQKTNPAPELCNSMLAPVLEITDKAGNVVGYANKDFAKVGSTVQVNGKTVAVADLRGEWKTAHHFTVVGE